MAQPSAKSKKFDQMYVAKAELTKRQVMALKRAVKGIEAMFLGRLAAELATQAKPSKLVERLKRTAKRAKMEPLDYARRYLLK